MTGPSDEAPQESQTKGDVRVYLIGGAPGVGKSTLGVALAARLGIPSVTVDDLVTVAHTVTTPESHPGLHVMRRVPHLDYFTHSALDQLQSDTEEQHRAVWPLVLELVRKRTQWAPLPIVIDGWHIRPRSVAAMGLEHVWAGWVVASPSVIEARERQNASWTRGSSNPDHMLANFVARSQWFNELVRTEATELGMNVLYQDGTATVDDLCAAVLSTRSGTSLR